jgi:hypothetical protein
MRPQPGPRLQAPCGGTTVASMEPILACRRMTPWRQLPRIPSCLLPSRAMSRQRQLTTALIRRLVRRSSLPAVQSPPRKAQRRNLCPGPMRPATRANQAATKFPGTSQHFRWLGHRGYSQRITRRGLGRPTATRRTVSSRPSRIQPRHASWLDPLRTRRLARRGSRPVPQRHGSPSASSLGWGSHQSHRRSRGRLFHRRPSPELPGMSRHVATQHCPLRRKTLPRAL